MAADKPTPPKGARSVASDSDQDEQISLSPGESIQGRVLTMRQVETDYGESGIVTLELEDGEVVDYFCKGEAKQAFLSGSIDRGMDVWIAKDVDEEEYQGTSYYPTMFRVIE